MASLRADLAQQTDRIRRQPSEISALRKRLGLTLAKEVIDSLATVFAHDSGADGRLKRRIAELEDEAVSLREDLADVREDLAAARQINRELTTTLNTVRR